MPSLVVNGFEFEFPARYMAGYECTVGDAAQLEKDRKNVFYVRVSKNLKKGMSPEHAQAELDTYAVKYQFGQRMSSGPRTKDPATILAMKNAVRDIREEFKKAGGRVGKLRQGLVNAKARARIADPNRGYMEDARRQLKKGDAAKPLVVAPDIADLLG